MYGIATPARRPGRRAGGLGRHLLEDERPTVTREAVAAADEADEHALACNAVLAELPEPRPGQLAAEALAATAEIGSENDKADILAWLILYFPGFRAVFSRFPCLRFPFYASQLPQIHERRNQMQRPTRKLGKPSAETLLSNALRGRVRLQGRCGHRTRPLFA